MRTHRGCGGKIAVDGGYARHCTGCKARWSYSQWVKISPQRLDQEFPWETQPMYHVAPPRERRYRLVEKTDGHKKRWTELEEIP